MHQTLNSILMEHFWTCFRQVPSRGIHSPSCCCTAVSCQGKAYTGSCSARPTIRSWLSSW